MGGSLGCYTVLLLLPRLNHSDCRAPRFASVAGSAQNAYMRRVYGERFEYQDFAPLFSCSDFDPAEWAALFKQSGAQGNSQ